MTLRDRVRAWWRTTHIEFEPARGERPWSLDAWRELRWQLKIEWWPPYDRRRRR